MNLFVLKTWLQTKIASDETGASMVEYGLLLALIAVVSIVVLTSLGNNVADTFTSVNTKL
jgi:pilus assembly protein Flp/PilA